MADPVTSATVPAAVGAGGIVLASLIPGVDVNAVIGGFAGALIFVVVSADLSVPQRIGYLIGSWIFGYVAATELASRQLVQYTGFAAFIGGLLCVGICIGLLDWMQTGKSPWWFRLARRGGKDG